MAGGHSTLPALERGTAASLAMLFSVYLITNFCMYKMHRGGEIRGWLILFVLLLVSPSALPLITIFAVDDLLITLYLHHFHVPLSGPCTSAT